MFLRHILLLLGFFFYMHIGILLLISDETLFKSSLLCIFSDFRLVFFDFFVLFALFEAVVLESVLNVLFVYNEVRWHYHDCLEVINCHCYRCEKTKG